MSKRGVSCPERVGVIHSAEGSAAWGNAFPKQCALHCMSFQVAACPAQRPSCVRLPWPSCMSTALS